VLLSQSASPSVVCLSSSRTILNLGFLTEVKLAAILITPSSWGSQRAGHSPRTRKLLVPSTTRQHTPPDDENAQAKGKGKEVTGQMVVLGQQGCIKETYVPSNDSITPVLHEY
jgi:hypothetical protein